MDTLRGYFGTPDFGDDEREYDFGDEDTGLEPPPSPVGQDERRMQVRAYNHWASLLGDKSFPAIEDLEPDQLPDFGPYSVLLDFSKGIEDPLVPFLGDQLATECGTDGIIDRLSDVPSRSLLSRITDHYMQILANQAPIGFEAEFVNQRGSTILYRGILLPFSSDNDTIDFVYGVINWKEMADQLDADELLLEIDQALEASDPAVDGGEDEVVAPANDIHELIKPAASTTDALPRPTFGSLAPLDDGADYFGSDEGEDEDEDELEGEAHYASLLSNIGDPDAEDGEDSSRAPANRAERPNKTPIDLSAFSPEPEEFADDEAGYAFGEPMVEDGAGNEPVSFDEQIADEFEGERSTEEPAPAESLPAIHGQPEIQSAPLVLDETGPAESGDSDNLYDTLAAARELAQAARNSEDRSRTALYQAVGRAYDVSLAAETDPAAFEELVAENGLSVQDRAPMTPVVKLVFGADYDKTRLTEYAAVLGHAHRLGIERGQLSGFLAQAEGGLKGVVQTERRLRREESGKEVEPLDAPREALACKLRELETRSLDEISPDGAEFAVVMIRRLETGEIVMIGEIDEDIPLIERVGRKLVA